MPPDTLLGVVVERLREGTGGGSIELESLLSDGCEESGKDES